MGCIKKMESAQWGLSVLTLLLRWASDWSSPSMKTSLEGSRPREKVPHLSPWETGASFSSASLLAANLQSSQAFPTSAPL